MKPSPASRRKPVSHTTTGRVVYDRPPHFFSATDIVRILSRFSFQTLTSSSALKLVSTVAEFYLALLHEVFTFFFAGSQALPFVHRIITGLLQFVIMDEGIPPAEREKYSSIYDDWQGLH
jgi:hypothetical protein